MKQRVLVMNGRRILESDTGGKWVTQKVESAGLLKPGIYNISSASPAEPGKSYEGTIVHSDKTHIFQKLAAGYVSFDRKAFEKLPEIGSFAKIQYEPGQIATVEKVEAKAKRLSL